MNEKPVAALYTRPQLKQVGVPYGDAQLRVLEKRGLFPKRVLLGRRTIAWLQREVDLWLEDKVLASRRPGGLEAQAKKIAAGLVIRRRELQAKREQEAALATK
jgi:hypothetical protein